MLKKNIGIFLVGPPRRTSKIVKILKKPPALLREHSDILCFAFLDPDLDSATDPIESSLDQDPKNWEEYGSPFHNFPLDVFERNIAKWLTVWTKSSIWKLFTYFWHSSKYFTVLKSVWIKIDKLLPVISSVLKLNANDFDTLRQKFVTN